MANVCDRICKMCIVDTSNFLTSVLLDLEISKIECANYTNFLISDKTMVMHGSLSFIHSY